MSPRGAWQLSPSGAGTTPQASGRRGRFLVNCGFFVVRGSPARGALGRARTGAGNPAPGRVGREDQDKRVSVRLRANVMFERHKQLFHPEENYVSALGIPTGRGGLLPLVVVEVGMRARESYTLVVAFGHCLEGERQLLHAEGEFICATCRA